MSEDLCTQATEKHILQGIASYANYMKTKAGFWVGFAGFGFGSTTTTMSYQSAFYNEM